MDRATLESLGVSPQKIAPDTYKITLRDVNQTIKIIEEFIREYSLHPQIRQLVASILKPCKSKDYTCYVRRIVEYIKQHVKYVNDPPKTEILQSPIRTLQYKIGDCDDHTILTGTLLRAAGFKIRITLGAPLGRFNHVYLHVYIPGHGWTTVDTTNANPLMKKPYKEREMVEIGNEPLEELGFSFKKLRRLVRRTGRILSPAAHIARKMIPHRHKRKLTGRQLARIACKGMKCFPPGSKLIHKKEGHFYKTYVRLPNGKMQLLYQKSIAPKPKPKPHPQKKRVHRKPHPRPKPLCVCITKQGVKVI
ncbi:transglutaminase-like domain-containing protein [Desulfurobacterium atlanticum]|uniref:Transglutaminase-like superfamily protein n=1 Tax=Desulfurobacterium atlanticum TaxID=240169 RepID=A0A238ZJQ8_9BACT|nr:transglutaminase-like domain-containing protein [Desulfurobacterium atlanticum]SNR83520.1 Transglutaminase-like superfamily protein [Desulfurobacterium atlanticum]